MTKPKENDIFSRNALFFSKKEMDTIKKARIAIVGVGGLGCVVAEILTRMGIGLLTLIDNGIVDMPDLGRQSLYNVEDIGQKKVDAAKVSLSKKTDVCKIKTAFIDIKADCQKDMLSEVDGVADCLDNYESRFALENCIGKNLFLVHGGVENDYGQITTIIKGKTQKLSDIYSNIQGLNKNRTIAVSTPSVFVVGSLMAYEVVNNILGKPKLINEMLVVELADFSFFKIKLIN